jgi:glucosamine--fructose-6-phosphate aminotransferase (isomerizing)
MEWAPAEAMLKQIRQQAEFTRPTVEALFLQLLRDVDVRPLRRARKVYLCGCGDSWFVGVATRLAFERHAAIEAEALHAMEFSRYAAATASPNALLVAVSHSGEVARTIEAALLAREKDIYTIAVTGNPKSSLAECCNATIHYTIPPQAEHIMLPGTISYLGCLLAGYLLAIYTGEVNGNTAHARADELYYNFKKMDENIAHAITTHLSQIIQWAEQCGAADTRLHGQVMQFIGSGPNYATALYGQMKLLEAAAIPSIVFETEEWAHAGFFLTHADTPLFVSCARGAGTDRTHEILQPAHELHARIMLVTNAPDLSAPSGMRLCLGEDVPEEFTPLLFSVPVQLLAYALMDKMRTTPFGFEDAHRREINSHQIRQSKIMRSVKDLTTNEG